MLQKACVQVAAVMLGLMLVVRPATAQRATSQIQHEIDGIARALKSKPASDPTWTELKPELDFYLNTARAALATGQVYLGLEQVGKAGALFTAEEYAEKHSSSTKDLTAFNAEWTRVSSEIGSFDHRAKDRSWSALPVVVRAFGETAAGQTDVLLHAASPYAKMTNPGAGLFYLGQIQALAGFANFCYALDLTRHGSSLALRSFAPELSDLQSRADAAFKPPRSIANHPQFIGMSATLKRAGELNSAGLYAGALYQYLDALLQLAVIEAPAPGAAAKTNLESALTVAQNQISPAGRDDSIAELMLQRAQLALTTKNGKEPDVGDLKTADAIITEVLPAYFAVLKAAPIPPETPVKRTTRVTLVRWPYT